MIAAQVLLSVQPITSAIIEPLAEAVIGALRKTGYRQLIDLQIRVDGHDVILRGRLPSYYLKQIAHHVVSTVPGVNLILDAIDVVS